MMDFPDPNDDVEWSQALLLNPADVRANMHMGIPG
jgi:hypothetical protein